MIQRVFGVIGLGLIAGGLAWLIFAGLPQWYGGPRQPAMVASAAPVPPPPPGRKIRAQLFYVADDGASLVGVEREIPYGEGAIAQAKEITIWCWDPNFNVAIMKEAGARYSKTHPDVTFNVVDLAKADVEQKLQTIGADIERISDG